MTLHEYKFSIHFYCLLEGFFMFLFIVILSFTKPRKEKKKKEQQSGLSKAINDPDRTNLNNTKPRSNIGKHHSRSSIPRPEPKPAATSSPKSEDRRR